MPLRARRRRRSTARHHRAQKAVRLDHDAIAELYARDPSAHLVVLVASPDAGHDSGSVAVAVARSWALHGRDVLFVDADASGSALAHRLGEATRASFSPATRGLPSLMAARRPITAELLREHCWRFATPGRGELSLLLGPTNASGAPLAAAWLGGCAAGLLAAAANRHTLVAMTTPIPRSHEAFIGAASAVVLVAPADTDEHLETLQALATSLIGAAKRCTPCLVIDGATHRSYEEIRTSSGMHVAGQLEGVTEQVLLRGQRRRRGVKSARLVEELAGRIAFLAAEGVHEGQEFAA